MRVEVYYVYCRLLIEAAYVEITNRSTCTQRDTLGSYEVADPFKVYIVDCSGGEHEITEKHSGLEKIVVNGEMIYPFGN